MKKLLLRRFFSFLFDFMFAFIVVLIAIAMPNPLITMIIFIFMFCLSLLLDLKFNGISIGRLIFRLKLVHFDDKITKKQKFINIFMRSILSIFSLFSLGLVNYFYFIKKRESNLLMIDTITKTTIVSSNKDYENLDKDFKSFSLAFFISINIFAFTFVFQLLDTYRLNKINTIQSEFNLFIDKNLVKHKLNNIKFNNNVKQCIWEGDDQIVGVPFFVLEFFYFNNLKDTKTRDEYISFFNTIFSKCIEESYPKAFLEKSILKK